MLKNLSYLPIALLIIAMHQIVQTFVFNTIEPPRNYIKVLPFFNLVEVWNPGISFGMFNNLSYGQWILSAVSAAITLVMLVWLWRATSTLKIITLCLIIGGAIGNLIDRVQHGAVADYLDFHAFGYHWPSFNVTDAAICLGVILLFTEELWRQPFVSQAKKND